MKLRRRLERRQLEWAQARGIETRRDETTGDALLQLVRLDDNFRVPLPEEVRLQLIRGSGGELNPPDGSEGHLYSLASSMALAINFFEPWRGAKASELAEVLGFEESRKLVCEFDVPVRLSPKRTEAPSMDVFLRHTSPHGFVYAVEAKFCEAYDGKPRPVLTRRYAERKDLLDGWPRLMRVARSITSRSDGPPARVHLAQIIRQLMVLRKNHGRANFALIHLWYDVQDRDARQYQAEIDDLAFKARQDGVAFVGLSWQQLFERVQKVETPEGWREYMDSRYGLSRVGKVE